MAFDAALVIRGASGALWMLVGALVVFLSRRQLGGFLLGCFALAFGGYFVAINLALADVGSDVAIVPVGLACRALAVAAAFALGWHQARGKAVGRALVVAGLMVAALPIFVGMPSSTASVQMAGYSTAAAELYGRAGPLGLAESVAIAVIVATAALRAREAADSREGKAAALLALAVGLYVGYNGALGLVEFGGLARTLVLGATIAASALWLTVGRLGRTCAWAMIAAPLIGAIAATWFGEATFGNIGNGVLRTIGATLLAVAVLRYDLLRVPLPMLAERRGALAATGLAVLFVTAQVAQNFFSAEYGLLTGGIVAGAFLFAAQPIQRALEGRRAPTAPARDSAKEEAYRKALRLAIRDGRVTREEELHLHEVAEHMGISVRRAHELLVEVERELQRDRV